VTPGPGYYDTTATTSKIARTTHGVILPEGNTQQECIAPGPGDYENRQMTSQHHRATHGLILPESSRGKSVENLPGPGYYEVNATTS